VIAASLVGGQAAARAAVETLTAGVAFLRASGSFKERVALVCAGLTWTEANTLTRIERAAVLVEMAERQRAENAEMERRMGQWKR
jgi:hypothetical protein